MLRANPDHTTKKFDTDLQELAEMTLEMGDYAEKQVVEAFGALGQRDRELGCEVVDADLILDAKEREIEDRAIAIIALRQPMAIDLRTVVGALKIARDLERVGDLAKNIGKRTISLDNGTIAPKAIPSFVSLTDLAARLLRDALDSYRNRDDSKAIDVWRRDREIDVKCKSLSEETIKRMTADPRAVAFGVHLLFCVKNIERIGDHATNIAEAVYYILQGRTLTGERPKAPDLTSVAAFSGAEL